METRTRSFVVICSECSMVRLFDDGELGPQIIPELWIPGACTTRLEERAFTPQNDIATIGRPA